MRRSTVDCVRRSNQTEQKSVRISKQRQTNGKSTSSRLYRWRCRGARPSLCPKQGWSLFGSSLRWLKEYQAIGNFSRCSSFSEADKCAFTTFNICDVDVELGEFFTRALHALIHRLQNLFWVFLHPPGIQTTSQVWRFGTEERLLRGFMRDILLTLPLGSSA